MKKLAIRYGTLALLIIIGVVASTHAGPGALRPKYTIELEVTPAEGQEHTYDSVVTVRDARTRAVVAQPKVHALEGKAASTSAAVPEPAMDISVTVEIGVGGKQASYTVELRDHNGVGASFKALVPLEKS
jgi:hypothetical protein